MKNRIRFVKIIVGLCIISLTGCAVLNKNKSGGDYPKSTDAFDSGSPPQEGNLAILRELDSTLNVKFKELSNMLQPVELEGLIATQRTWIKNRNKTCDIDNKIQQLPTWLERVAKSDFRSDCVIKSTQKRISELEQMQAQLKGPPVFSEIQPEMAEPTCGTGRVEHPEIHDSAYLSKSNRSHQSGKFYFEIVIDETNADQIKANVSARVNDNRHWTGISYDIQSRNLLLRLTPNAKEYIEIVGGNLGDLRIPRTIIGIAVDLDNGFFYSHHNSKWINGVEPGNKSSLKLNQNSSFIGEIKADVNLSKLQEKQIIKINYGDAPFINKLPTGYRGFDWPDHLVETYPFEDTVVTRYPSDKLKSIAGETQVQWIRRYWEWGRSFSKNESPSADSNGERCSAGQSGPVWFLTGSNASGPVNRECEIPAGKILLIPIVNTLVQSNKDDQCDQILISLRQFSTGISGLYCRLNGKELKNLEQEYLDTGCFKLNDITYGKNGLAAGNGYWVFLPPLEKGRHVIEFGGKFIDGFQQNISYAIEVR